MQQQKENKEKQHGKKEYLTVAVCMRVNTQHDCTQIVSIKMECATTAFQSLSNL